MQLLSATNPPEPRRRANSKGIKPDTLGSWITSFMGRPKGSSAADKPEVTRPTPDQIYPMAFIVEQDPHSTLGAHFHTVDQFQVFTRGDGLLAADTVRPTTVQFVSPHSPYGPITAGAEGVSYFTLRNAFDPGARFMPGAREELPPRPRQYRQVLGGPVPPLADAKRIAAKSPSQVELIALGKDGLGAWLFRVPPGGSITGPDPKDGRGQHWVVIGGTIEQEGEQLEHLSVGFLAPDEPAYIAKAGPQGLEILALQYPKRPDLSH